MTTSFAPVTHPGSLAQYLRFLWRRKFALLLPALVAVGVAVVLTQRQAPVFESSTDLLFSSSGERTDPGDRVNIPTEARIATSPAVLDEAAAAVGGASAASLAPLVTAEQVEDLEVMRISARGSSGSRAQEIASAVADAYLDLSRRRAEEHLASQGAAIATRLAELAQELDRVGAALAAAEAAGQVSEAQALRTRRDLLIGAQAVQQARLRELPLVPTTEISILVPARVPDSPVSPRVAQTALVAGLVGLLAGFALALTREHLNVRVRRISEVEAALQAPVLAVVPRLRGRRAQRAPLAVLDRPGSEMAEAFRIVRSNLVVAGVGQERGVVLVTSALAGEGKSTVAANLAAAFAEMGRDTVVVDADLRRPRLHRLFGLSNNDRGLSSVLNGDVEPLEAANEISADHLAGRLACLPSGPGQSHPFRWLSGGAFEGALAALRRTHIVIVDSPPALPLADFGDLSAHADAIVVVVRPDLVNPGVLNEMHARVVSAGASVLGVVVNAPSAGTFEGSGSYGYYYGSAERTSKREGVPGRGRLGRRRNTE